MSYDHIIIILLCLILLGVLSLVVFGYIFLFKKKIEVKKQKFFKNKEKVLSLPESSEKHFNDIKITPIDAKIFSENKNNVFFEDSGLIKPYEDFMKLLPSSVNSWASSKGLYKITFGPEVTRELLSGKYSFMQSSEGLRAIAVDKSHKIVSQGLLSPDKLMKGIATMTIAWEILSRITAQKFLSDINKRLTSIDNKLENIYSFVKAHEQGRLIGDIKYITEIENKIRERKGTKNVAVLENQIESIYIRGMHSVETNSILLELDINEIKDGNSYRNKNLKGIEDFFEEKIKSYKESVFRVFASYFVMVLSENIKFTIKPGVTNKELDRTEKIKIETQEFLEKIKQDEKTIKEKCEKITGNRWEEFSEKILKKNKIKVSKEKIKQNVSQFIEDYNKISQSINDRLESIKNLKTYVENIKNNGMVPVSAQDGHQFGVRWPLFRFDCGHLFVFSERVAVMFRNQAGLSDTNQKSCKILPPTMEVTNGSKKVSYEKHPRTFSTPSGSGLKSKKSSQSTGLWSQYTL